MGIQTSNIDGQNLMSFIMGIQGSRQYSMILFCADYLNMSMD